MAATASDISKNSLQGERPCIKENNCKQMAGLIAGGVGQEMYEAYFTFQIHIIFVTLYDVGCDNLTKTAILSAVYENCMCF
jgi:hypothetical protein